MNAAEAAAVVRGALGRIVPEADLDALAADVLLQEELDMDSMDFLNFTVALADATGLDIPERDGAALATFAGCVDYLVRRSAATPSGPEVAS